MKHKLITLVLAVAVIASLVLTGCAKPVAPPVAPPVTPPEEPAPEPEEKPALPTRILFGSSAGVTSSWYPMYVKIAELTNKGLDAHVTMVLPGGSAASLQAVYAGDSDVGVTNVAAMYQAVQGLGAWEGNPQPNCMRAFYHCSKYTLCIVVRADSDMFDIGDLAGKHVYLGRPGSSSHVFMHITLSANDIEVGEEFVGTLSDAVAAFKDRRIDAYLKPTTGHQVDATHLDIMTRTDIRFLGFTDEQMENIRAESGFLDFMEYPTGWWLELPDHPTVTIMTGAHVLLAKDDFPEEFAYQFTKSSVEKWDECKDVFWGAADDPLDMSVLLEGEYMHPGAIRYFREMGVEIPESAIPPEMS